MKRVITFLSVILMMAAIIAPAYSQNDERSRGFGFLMLEEPVNPRNIGMGSAGTALGGAGFRYYNPVGPFFSASAQGTFVTAEFGQLPGEVNSGGFETALVTRGWFSAVSFYSSSVDFETRDERGFGSAASSAVTIGAASAGYIKNNMSAGIGLTMAEDRIWIKSYTAFALSAGLGYKLLDDKLSLGAAGFHGIAWSTGFGDDASSWQKGNVPRFARGGVAWTDTIKSFPYIAAADVVYRDEDGTFTVPIGLEVNILPVVDLRIGKRIGWETEIISLGLGLNIGQISFDAAFVPCVFVDDYDIKWNMSFTYNLGKLKDKGKKPSKKLHIEEELHIKGTPEQEDAGVGADAETDADNWRKNIRGDRIDEDGNIIGVDGDGAKSEDETAPGQDGNGVGVGADEAGSAD